jgi:hypothetical protein
MQKISFPSKSILATLAGILAIIMWSSNVAVSKTAMNDLGTYSAEFTEKFEAEQGTSNCSDLTRCDLQTEEGQKKFKEENIKEKVCEKCVLSSIEILNKMMD